jgi:hypothetical protein
MSWLLTRKYFQFFVLLIRLNFVSWSVNFPTKLTSKLTTQEN